MELSMRRILSLLLAAVLGACVAVAISLPSSSGAATTTTYSLTVNGTDAVPLNPRFVPVFVDGGGTQATFSGNSDTATGPNLFETHLDLPVGAKVTSLAISLSGGLDSPGTYTFAAYTPTTRTATQLLTFRPPVGPFRTVTKTGSPITTVAAGRRYVLDWNFPSITPTVDKTTGIFYGATVKYTCAAPCNP